MTKNTVGLYLHIPFCKTKCNYCDFFTVKYSEENKDKFLLALSLHIKLWGEKCDKIIDSIYFGGGTPSMLSADDFKNILTLIGENFSVSENCEITTESNPENLTLAYCKGLKNLGFNRISIGVQSSDEKTLETLGRNHSSLSSFEAIENCKIAGFSNISCDLIIGNENETMAMIKNSIEKLAEQNIQHISLYQLKIEEGTQFFKDQNTLALPSDDTVADNYLLSCSLLESLGFHQYEISNFSKPTFESRHNLKYWQCEEYIGIAPSAHSLFDGNRFYYPKSFSQFNSSENLSSIIHDEEFSEIDYVIMNIRLTKGVDISLLLNYSTAPVLKKKIAELEKDSLAKVTDKNYLTLTPKGFLISNSIINFLLN